MKPVLKLQLVMLVIIAWQEKDKTRKQQIILCAQEKHGASCHCKHNNEREKYAGLNKAFCINKEQIQ